MKAITVRQPWAWAIATGAKTVENRARGTTYRGPLAIHTALRWSDRGSDCALIQNAHGYRMFSTPGLRIVPMPHPELFPTGAVIAVAQLVDAHPDTGCCRPWGESSYTEAGGRTRTVIHHLVLDDIHALTAPVRARGALGLWTPDRDLLDALGAAA
jgi:hypothetical protein